jgi:hypothetical protein
MPIPLNPTYINAQIERINPDELIKLDSKLSRCGKYVQLDMKALDDARMFKGGGQITSGMFKQVGPVKTFFENVMRFFGLRGSSDIIKTSDLQMRLSRKLRVVVGNTAVGVNVAASGLGKKGIARGEVENYEGLKSTYVCDTRSGNVRSFLGSLVEKFQEKDLPQTVESVRLMLEECRSSASAPGTEQLIGKMSLDINGGKYSVEFTPLSLFVKRENLSMESKPITQTTISGKERTPAEDINLDKEAWLAMTEATRDSIVEYYRMVDSSKTLPEIMHQARLEQEMQKLNEKAGNQMPVQENKMKISQEALTERKNDLRPAFGNQRAKATGMPAGEEEINESGSVISKGGIKSTCTFNIAGDGANKLALDLVDVLENADQARNPTRDEVGFILNTLVKQDSQGEEPITGTIDLNIGGEAFNIEIINEDGAVKVKTL